MEDKKKRSILNIALVVAVILFLASAIASFPYLHDAACGTFACNGPVKVEKSRDGWRLMVAGRPYFVKGVCYQYVPIGQGEQYDIFAGPGRPWLADGKILKSMGVNTVRFYKPGADIQNTRRAIRDLYKRFGIRTALGHYLGFWSWPPPNYADPVFRAKIKEDVVAMVKAYKDEDGILFWILGNENNYSFDRGIRDWSTPEIDSLGSPLKAREAKARIYYRFLNELALAVKEVDRDHPVVMGNGELASINIAKEEAPDIDILGGIVYQGKTFGTYFERLKRNYGKPNVFIEFGSDAYDAVWQQESQDWQAFFIKLQWNEIWKNRAGSDGAGNSLGGFVFEWTDEWWKHNPGYVPGWKTHDTEAGWANTAYYFDTKAGNNINEEWWGIAALDSKNMRYGFERRIPRKAFYVLKSLWRSGPSGRSRIYPIFAIVFLAISILLAMIRRR